jgi:hypothetical protein
LISDLKVSYFSSSFGIVILPLEVKGSKVLDLKIIE